MIATQTNFTTKKLCSMADKGEINFNLAVQRSNIWKDEQKTALIYSILKGFPTGVMYFRKNGDTYDAVDGKQRTSAIRDFRDDLIELEEDFEDTGYGDLGGLSYEALPQEAKDAIDDYNFSCVLIDCDSDEELADFFYRINNGTQLSTVEKTRVKSVSFDKFKQIASHDFLQTILTAKAKAGYKDEEIAMQLFGIYDMENPDFSTKVFKPYIQKAVVDDYEVKVINDSLDYVSELFRTLDTSNKTEKKVYNKIKTKIHLVAMAYLARLCILDDVAFDIYKKAVIDFFDTDSKFNCTTSTAYNNTLMNHSASQQCVTNRKKAIDTLYEEILNNATASDEEEIA